MPRWYPRDSRAYFAAITHATIDANARITFSTLLDIAGAEGDVAEDGTVCYMGAPVTATMLCGLTGVKPLRARQTSLQVQELALLQLQNHGLIRLSDEGVAFTEKGRVCEFKPDPDAAARMRRVRERSRTSANEERNSSPPVQECSALEREVELDTPLSPSGDSPPQSEAEKPKRVRPEVPEVEFSDEDETRVRSMLAIVAAENQSGTMAATKVKALRTRLHGLLAEHGPEAWRYGLDVAIGRAKGMEYAVSVVLRHARKLTRDGQLAFAPSGASTASEDPVAAQLRGMVR